jgi:hypothetical protein
MPLRLNRAVRDPIPYFMLILHELTTNAVKYGALSVPAGGEADSVMLTKDVLDSLSTDSARANWQRIAAYGPLRAFDFAGREIEGDGRATPFPLEVRP